ncbi:mannonate dehydratase [Roseibium aquae]|uniref:Mannonate dehydratase n=1 Tax=Roseibium aquae TaxID=1323746 RepID=A0A916X2D4_9HYPH|nr:mannonate dehydratase [Roseibium aquae]GGB53695.1 mannonate dehydratase [Roseibium aquae]
MRQTWRWFGPTDRVSLSDIRQAGAQGVVTALHHVPAGMVWTRDEIAERQRQVAGPPDRPTGLTWDVVESLPVSEAIKTQTGPWREHLTAYEQSLENLAHAGISTICYNFMPVLDWTRTDLAWRVSHGGTAMRFDLIDFAAFDLHLLARPGAEADYHHETKEAARARFEMMGKDARQQLASNVLAGLPGSAERWTLDTVREQLAAYGSMDTAVLRRHHVDFLGHIVPLCERLGLRMCCHPDDPPFPLLGLPRIMSTSDDYAALFDAVDSPAAGMTLCTGSLGARPDNECAAMVRRFGPKIHFLHLRNVTRDTETVPCSFFEDEHLAGQTDMVAVIAAVLEEEARRKREGRADWEIPMRPDHGQDILDDLGRCGQPGYPAIGRLKGLAELRGVMTALSAGAPSFGLEPGVRREAVHDPG